MVSAVASHLKPAISERIREEPEDLAELLFEIIGHDQLNSLEFLCRDITASMRRQAMGVDWTGVQYAVCEEVAKHLISEPMDKSATSKSATPKSSQLVDEIEARFEQVDISEKVQEANSDIIVDVEKRGEEEVKIKVNDDLVVVYRKEESNTSVNVQFKNKRLGVSS